MDSEQVGIDPRAALVYSEALRSITQQQGVLDQLRSRAGTLLGALWLATGFLAGLDGQDNGFGLWGWIAVVPFAVAVSGVCAILWPRHRWRFSMDADILIKGFLDADPPPTLDVMHRVLAGFLQRDYRANRDCLRWMFYIFEVATVMTVIEIVSWIIDLRRA